MRVVLPVVSKPANLNEVQLLRSKYPDALIVLPELYTTSYNALDLLKIPSFVNQVFRLQQELLKIPNLVFGGIVEATDNKLYNAAFITISNTHRVVLKYNLPTYSEFYEARHFQSAPKLTDAIGVYGSLGIVICEDVWHEKTWEVARSLGVKTLIAINASPYYKGKLHEKAKLFQTFAVKYGINMIYQNWYTGFDELTLIDRLIVLKNGQTKVIVDPVDIVVNVDDTTGNLEAIYYSGSIVDPLQIDEYKLIADYIIRLNMEHYIPHKKVVIGVSGGIDSAVVLGLATRYHFDVDAYFLPSKYTSEESYQSIKLLQNAFDIEIKTVHIDEAFATYQLMGKEANVDFSSLALQNLQSRIRGTFLMTVSNTTGAFLLACGNKTEYALGYATL